MAFIDYVSDFGKMGVNNILESTTLGFAPDKWRMDYNTRSFDKIGGGINTAMGIVGQTAATLALNGLTGGIGGTVAEAGISTTKGMITEPVTSIDAKKAVLSGLEPSSPEVGSMQSALLGPSGISPNEHPELEHKPGILKRAENWLGAEDVNVAPRTIVQNGEIVKVPGVYDQNDLLSQSLTSDYRKSLIAMGIQGAGRVGALISSLNKDRPTTTRTETSPEISFLNPVSSFAANEKAREDEIIASGLYTAREMGSSPEGIIAAAFRNSGDTASRVSQMVTGMVNQQNAINADIRMRNAGMVNENNIRKIAFDQAEADRQDELNSLLWTTLGDVAGSAVGTKTNLDLAKYKLFYNR